MAENISLKVEIREEVGKGAARALRRNNLVPGIIYGGEQNPCLLYTSPSPRDS